MGGSAVCSCKVAARATSPCRHPALPFSELREGSAAKGRGPRHARDTVVLVEVGPASCCPGDAADDRQESVAAHEYYGRSIGVPELKPHDLRHGVAMDVRRAPRSRKVRALLGPQRIDTPQIYASIRPTQLKRRWSSWTREGESDVGSPNGIRALVGHLSFSIAGSAVRSISS
jgi:hypothetical protein